MRSEVADTVPRQTQVPPHLRRVAPTAASPQPHDKCWVETGKAQQSQPGSTSHTRTHAHTHTDQHACTQRHAQNAMSHTARYGEPCTAKVEACSKCGPARVCQAVQQRWTPQHMPLAIPCRTQSLELFQYLRWYLHAPDARQAPGASSAQQRSPISKGSNVTLRHARRCCCTMASSRSPTHKT